LKYFSPLIDSGVLLIVAVVGLEGHRRGATLPARSGSGTPFASVWRRAQQRRFVFATSDKKLAKAILKKLDVFNPADQP
jgi:hypothetical protein